MLNAFKSAESVLPNSLAFSFAIVGYALGVCGLYWRGWRVFFDCDLNDLRH